MATLQQLEQALIGADRAGDTTGAKLLAEEIVRMRAAPPAPVPAAAPAAVSPPPAAGESWRPGPVVPPPERPAEIPLSDMGAPVEPPSMAQATPTTGIAPGRAAALGGQAAASGLTSVAMLPLDIPALLQKGAGWGLDRALSAGGSGLNRLFETGKFTYPPEVPKGASPRLTLPVPSEGVKNLASQMFGSVTPETTGEKAFYNVVEQGTGAAGGATALSRMAAGRAAALAEPGALPLRFDKYVRPYFDQPKRTIFGDTAAGAAAGGALTGSQALPESVRERGGGTVGAGADLLAMLTGGVSGGTLASGITGAPTDIGNLILKNRPALNVPVDPVTGLHVSNQTADDVTRIIRGSVTTEPKSLAQSLTQGAQGFRDQGLPVPTTGQLAEGELAGVERRQRTQPPTLFQPDTPEDVRKTYSFIERDAAQKQAASDELEKIRQADVSREVIPAPAPDPRIPNALPRQQPLDSELFARRAQERADAELAARQRQVDQPTGRAAGIQQAREEAAQPVIEQQGATPDASTRIFDTYSDTRTAEQTRSDALYSRPEFTEHAFDITPMQRAAAEVRAEAAKPGSAAVTDATENILQRIESAAETGTLPGSQLSKLNADIEGLIAENLDNKALFRQLKELKNSIAQSITALPKAHPAREAIDIARANTADVIAPNFRTDVGSSLDARLKTNPGQVIPETAGAEFLERGSSTRQLQDIGALRGNAQEVAEQSRAIVFDQLTGAGVLKDGVLDPAKLTAWRNQNNHIIREIPGLSDEVNGMIASARKGSNTAGQYAEEIAAAEARFKGTEKAIAKGPVGKLEGRTPREAVDNIMDGNNAAKNIAELRKQTGNSPDAVKSLKANIADHFIDKVKAIDPALSDVERGVSLRKLINNFNDKREALVAAGFTPDEMQALQRAQTILKPLLNRNVQATVGSITAENTAAAMRPLEMALKIHYGTLKGGSVFRNVKQGLALAKGDNTQAIEALLTRAMFDPELAATLLTRDVAKAGTPAWNAELQKLLRRTEAAKGLAEGEEE